MTTLTGFAIRYTRIPLVGDNRTDLGGVVASPSISNRYDALQGSEECFEDTATPT